MVKEGLLSQIIEIVHECGEIMLSATDIERKIHQKAGKGNFVTDYDSRVQEALKMRQIWCEGTFSAQKRSHNLRQIFRRGLEAAEDHGLLSAAALNLKRLIKCLG